MTHWTVLWIIMLGGDFDGERTALLFKTEAACEERRGAVYDLLEDQYEFILACEPTDEPSGSIRPKRRPEL